MAIQILPGQSRTAGLGQAVGTGLGQGLQMLLQDKMNRMVQKQQQAQTTQGLQSLGIPEQQASQISMLPKELQGLVVKNFLAGAEGAGLEQALSGLRGEPAAPVSDIGAQREMVSPDQEQVGIPMEQGIQTAPEQRGASRFADILRRPRLKPEHRLKVEELAQKKRLAGEAIKEKRITSDLQAARGDVKEAQGVIESATGSIRAYKDIRRLLKSGTPVTGMPAYVLKKLGIDKSVTGWQTQLMDKLFAGEPIRALRGMPGQATRLSKVFDTLKDMHGSLINTPEGIDAIARSKIVEAKSIRAINKKYLEMLESRRKSGRAIPFDLKNQAAKAVSSKLRKYEFETQYIISDSIEKNGAKLDQYEIGEKVISDDGSGNVFVKKNIHGKDAWVMMEER